MKTPIWCSITTGNLAYISRINLDVLDPAHRVTLLTPVDATTHIVNKSVILDVLAQDVGIRGSFPTGLPP